MSCGLVDAEDGVISSVIDNEEETPNNKEHKGFEGRSSFPARFLFGLVLQIRNIIHVLLKM